MSPRSAKGGRVPTARTVAATVLIRVLRDDAFAAAALDTELERALQLDPRDRGLATELVYGVLRTQPVLEEHLGSYAPKGLNRLDLQTRVHLLVAAYQLLCLDRIPAFAAVSEGVENVSSGRGKRLAGFANAVLRKVADQAQRSGPLDALEATRLAAPPWLVDQIARALGSADRAKDLIAAGPIPPPLCIRLRDGQERDTWLGRLEAHLPHAEVAEGRVAPRCITLRGAGKPDELPGHGSAWSVQEEGSQLVAIALGAQAGERVLDACAGRGNKTSYLAEKVGRNGSVDAADLHPSKLNVLQAMMGAADLAVPTTHAVDWTVGAGSVPSDFDRVLVDAPCSGVGTLRRRPELVRRDLKSALPGLQALQAAILTEASTRCRPGGRVVYAVCSVLREEAEEVIALARSRGAALAPAPFDAEELRDKWGEASSFRLLPQEHGTDGYFVASFLRTG